METADTTIVVTTPSSGDAVQIIKAGILEIADIFVVNKADLPGAAKVVRDLRELVRHGKRPHRLGAAGVLTIAETGDGVDELVAAIDEHGAADRRFGRARAPPDRPASSGGRGDRRRAGSRARANRVT